MLVKFTLTTGYPITLAVDKIIALYPRANLGGGTTGCIVDTLDGSSGGSYTIQEPYETAYARLQAAEAGAK